MLQNVWYMFCMVALTCLTVLLVVGTIWLLFYVITHIAV